MSADSRFYLNMVKSTGQYSKCTVATKCSVLQQASTYTFFWPGGWAACTHPATQGRQMSTSSNVARSFKQCVSCCCQRALMLHVEEWKPVIAFPCRTAPGQTHTRMHTTTNRHILYNTECWKPFASVLCKRWKSFISEGNFIINDSQETIIDILIRISIMDDDVRYCTILLLCVMFNLFHAVLSHLASQSALFMVAHGNSDLCTTLNNRTTV